MPSDRPADDLDALIREHREAAQFAVTTENHKDGALEDLVAAEAALRARLSELRARADELEKCRAKWRMEWRAELRARRAAERALAECRAKTIDECVAIYQTGGTEDESEWDYFSTAAEAIRALKTKEPT